MKTIHVAEMIADGGRDGTVEAPDGNFSVTLSTDERPESVTPEHLFAGAYASCFLGALKNAAVANHCAIEGVTVVGRGHLTEDDGGGYRLSMELRAAIPGVTRSTAEHLLHLAHQSCPYSKATRGNIDIQLNLD